MMDGREARAETGVPFKMQNHGLPRGSCHGSARLCAIVAGMLAFGGTLELRADQPLAADARAWALGNLSSGAARPPSAPITQGFNLVPVVLEAPPDGDAVRAMWLYVAVGCRVRVGTEEEAQDILDFCAAEGINRIYFRIDELFNLDNVNAMMANVRSFLNTAYASGIRVEALLDGIDTHKYPDQVRSNIDRILDSVHAPTPMNTDDDFAAIHFDVEFWLDPDWPGPQEDRQAIARQYLDNILVNARNHLDSRGATYVDISADLSAHFDNPGMLPAPMVYDATTQAFVQHVLDHADDVVFMNYYDTAAQILYSSEWELQWASEKGRRVQLGAMIQAGHLPINTFADNAPDPYTAMTTELTAFHASLTTTQANALDGFSVFHYDGYSEFAPQQRSTADLDGDGDVDLEDFALFIQCLGGPNTPPPLGSCLP